MIDIRPEDPARDADAIEALYDATFGPGHFAKTAERLREFSVSLPALSRVADKSGEIVGVCRIWPVEIETGPSAVLAGPVAVAEPERGRLLSIDLARAALQASKQAGWGTAILIGALSLFERAGFRPAAAGSLILPGPVDPARVLIADLNGDADALAGAVSAPRAARP
ncbi:MAG: N-acetyltransferase [Pseudomonadota bacterium]